MWVARAAGSAVARSAGGEWAPPAAGLGWRERVDRVEGRLEGVGVRVAEGEAQDDSPAGADDPGGDVEQEPAQCAGVAA